MTPEERIVSLERELAETRRAAVDLVAGLVSGLAPTPEGREEIAASFDAEAIEQPAGAEMAHLARLVAAALRE